MTGEHIFKNSTFSTILESLLTAGMIGSFVLLWSMSHSLARIGDRLEALDAQAQSFDASLSSLTSDLYQLDRRVLLLEQRLDALNP